MRLVGDEVDANARGVAGQVLRVALRDQVRIVYPTALGEVRQLLRVGRPGDEGGSRAARQAVLRVVVLRAYPGGPPVIGVDDLSALRIVREEIAIANEIWLQCLITFGAPSETSVSIVDPPGPTLLSIGDGDGLPARGGSVRFRVDGVPIGPIETVPDALPQDTAVRVAQALRAAGFAPSVTVNPPAVFGAGPSADVLVRRNDGAFVVIEPIEGVPLTSDRQQRITIGSVDLGDGLEEFDNMTAQSGTLEERTMIKALGDEDPATIDLFIINRFSHGTRQGEAFIAASSGPITQQPGARSQRPAPAPDGVDAGARARPRAAQPAAASGQRRRRRANPADGLGQQPRHRQRSQAARSERVPARALRRRNARHAAAAARVRRARASAAQARAAGRRQGRHRAATSCA